MNISVVTTFHEQGYRLYGKRMIQTFLENWPKNVNLYVYAENCTVEEKAENLIVLDLMQVSKELKNFKEKWKDVPYANGDISSIPALSVRRDSKKAFKWDAVRFSHKVYSIFHCSQQFNHNTLIWMDADMICHSKISENIIQTLCPDDKDLCFLGRRGKFTECGLYAMNLRSESVKIFLKEFQQMYDNAESGIFQQEEWHDSFIFDVVRKNTKLNELDWSSHLVTGEGHPLINSEWGAYLDHLKGNRKVSGKSLKSDLITIRKESYWQ